MGSSPRGRGKQHARRVDREAPGLIPAWAGKTSEFTRMTRRGRAHPRVGGENYPTEESSGTASGSSPRGRGKLLDGVDDDAGPGLIPAWAGKTTPPRSPRPPARAHPRVGGENIVDRIKPALTDGSSPRGRGKLALTSHAERSAGLIPAWAGKTSSVQAAAPPMRAHPRVGGENASRPRFFRISHGSSPRGRGKHEARLRSAGFCGLIPAWAGKTQACPPFPKRPWAHPRVGGENRYPRINGDKAGGSSPRGRGKLELDGL